MNIKSVIYLCLSILVSACGGSGGGSGGGEGSGPSATGNLDKLVKSVAFLNVADSKIIVDTYSTSKNNEKLMVINHVVGRSLPIDYSKEPDTTMISIDEKNNSINWKLTQNQISEKIKLLEVSNCVNENSVVDTNFIKKYDSGYRSLMTVYNYNVDWRPCVQLWSSLDDTGEILTAKEILLDDNDTSLMTTPPLLYNGYYYTINNSRQEGRSIVAFTDDDTVMTSQELSVLMEYGNSLQLLNANTYDYLGTFIESFDSMVVVGNRIYVMYTVLGRRQLVYKYLGYYDAELKQAGATQIERDTWSGNVYNMYSDLVMKNIDESSLGVLYLVEGEQMRLKVFDNSTNISGQTSDYYTKPSGKILTPNGRRGTQDIKKIGDKLYTIVNYITGANTYPQLGSNRQLSVLSTYDYEDGYRKDVPLILSSNNFTLNNLKEDGDSIFAVVEKNDSYPNIDDSKFLGKEVGDNDYANFDLNKDIFNGLNDIQDRNATVVDNRYSPPEPPTGGGGSGGNMAECDTSKAKPFNDVQLDVFCQSACYAVNDPGTDNSVADSYCGILDQYVSIGSLSSNSCSYCR